MIIEKSRTITKYISRLSISMCDRGKSVCQFRRQLKSEKFQNLKTWIVTLFICVHENLISPKVLKFDQLLACDIILWKIHQFF